MQNEMTSGVSIRFACRECGQLEYFIGPSYRETKALAESHGWDLWNDEPPRCPMCHSIAKAKATVEALLS